MGSDSGFQNPCPAFRNAYSTRIVVVRGTSRDKDMKCLGVRTDQNTMPGQHSMLANVTDTKIINITH